MKDASYGLLLDFYLWPWTTKVFEIEIYTSSESWINMLSIDARTIFGRDTTIWKSEIWGFKKIQMKFLAMHITNQKLSFNIFTVGNLQNIIMEHDLYLIF